jgi:oligoendopeptidase F
MNLTWNLTPLFNSDKDPAIDEKRKLLLEENYKFINKWKDRKDYLEDPKILREALDELEYLAKNYGDSGDEGYYFFLRSSQDQTDPTIKAKLSKIRDIAVKISNDIEFFEHRVAKIPLNKQKEFLESPDLIPYRHSLEVAFNAAKYMLSEEEEKILNLTSHTSYSNWVRMTSEFLSKEEAIVLNEDGKKQKKNFSEIESLIDSKNKKVRDGAAKAFNKILETHTDEAEAEINSVLEYKKTIDDLRNVQRPDLLTLISDDVDTEIVDTLLDAVSQRFHISQRYYELKAKMMGVKKLKYHERNVELGSIRESYSWDETIKIIDKTFTQLDPQILYLFHNLLDEGRFDVYPKKNKTGGGFCAANLPTQPFYILLDHTNKLTDVLTVAHETGHAINDILVAKTQNAINFGTPTSTAEVASTFMEDFVLQALEKDADEETRLNIMMKKLNGDISAIQRQVACYKFEQELHKTFREKGYLSKDVIGEMFQKHMASYMGPSVEMSPGSQNWWIYWSHIRSFFYVYSYAGGLLISKSLQNSVKKDHKFMEQVKEFLSAGTSDSPKNIFLKMGIDITDKAFWNRGLDEIESLLQETEKLAEQLGKKITPGGNLGVL